MRGSFAVLASARGAGSLLQAALFIALARTATVSDVGLVATIISLGGLASIVFDFGVQTHIQRAQALGKRSEVVSALKLNHLSGLLLGVASIAALASVYFVAAIPWPLIGLGAWLALEKCVETSLAISVATGLRSALLTSILGRRMCALTLFLAGSAISIEPLAAYSFAQLTASLAGFLHVTIVNRRRYDYAAGIGNDLSAVAAAAPFWVSSIFGQARLVDTTLLTILSGSSAAGFYGAASRVTNPLLLASSALSAVLLAHTARGGGLAARRAARLVALVMTAAGLLVVALSPLSETVMLLLYGTAYRGTGSVLTAVLASTPMLALTSQLTSILQARGHERFVARTSVGFGIFLVVALGCSAAVWGPIGLAWSLAACYALRSTQLYVRISKNSEDDQQSDGPAEYKP